MQVFILLVPLAIMVYYVVIVVVALRKDTFWDGFRMFVRWGGVKGCRFVGGSIEKTRPTEEALTYKRFLCTLSEVVQDRRN